MLPDAIYVHADMPITLTLPAYYPFQRYQPDVTPTLFESLNAAASYRHRVAAGDAGQGGCVVSLLSQYKAAKVTSGESVEVLPLGEAGEVAAFASLEIAAKEDAGYKAAKVTSGESVEVLPLGEAGEVAAFASLEIAAKEDAGYKAAKLKMVRT
ncbi:hypothetical protein PRIC2_004330 [Phytophthora ramorum]